MVASWHTNVHEYAELRVRSWLRLLPSGVREWFGEWVGRGTMWAVTRFYGIAHFVAAPSQLMTDVLRAKTGRPGFVMGHGVNTALFAPSRRERNFPFVLAGEGSEMG